MFGIRLMFTSLHAPLSSGLNLTIKMSGLEAVGWGARYGMPYALTWTGLLSSRDLCVSSVYICVYPVRGHRHVPPNK